MEEFEKYSDEEAASPYRLQRMFSHTRDELSQLQGGIGTTGVAPEIFKPSLRIAQGVGEGGEESDQSDMSVEDAELIISNMQQATSPQTVSELLQPMNRVQTRKGIDAMQPIAELGFILGRALWECPDFDRGARTKEENVQVATNLINRHVRPVNKIAHIIVTSLVLTVSGTAAEYADLQERSKEEGERLDHILQSHPDQAYEVVKELVNGSLLAENRNQEMRFGEWVEMLAYRQYGGGGESGLNLAVSQLEQGVYDNFIFADLVQHYLDHPAHLPVARHVALVGDIAKSLVPDSDSQRIMQLVMANQANMPVAALQEVQFCRQQLLGGMHAILDKAAARLQAKGYTVTDNGMENEIARRFEELNRVFIALRNAKEQPLFRVLGSYARRDALARAAVAERRAAQERETVFYYELSDFVFDKHGAAKEESRDDKTTEIFRRLDLRGVGSEPFKKTVDYCLQYLRTLEQYDKVPGVKGAHRDYPELYALNATQAKRFQLGGPNRRWLVGHRILFARNPDTKEIGLVDIVKSGDEKLWAEAN